MTPARDADACCSSDHCITCADDGIEMTVVRVNELAGLALCEDAAGARSTVETALVEAPSPGDRILVHAGTAIAQLQPAERAAVEAV